MDQPTQQLPRPPRRRPRTLVLTAVLGTLLVAGVVAAVLAAVSDRTGPEVAGDESLDLLFAPAVALQDDQNELAARPEPGHRPLKHWRNGPLRLKDGERVIAGTVASVTGGSLVVRTDNGTEVTVPTDGDTKVRGNGNRSLADLSAGERVIVKAGADGKAVGVLAVRAHVAGTVTRLEGDRATVVTPGGLTRELDLSGVTQRPAVGTAIVAVGTAAEEGATLKVEQLRELPTIR
ncbi:MAG TPA: hypothetical protein VFM37_05865 [Pseudonocardiaceae bacterium]|nr:hypothetical protein [Pseudonocardiaceae bacterium]